MKQSAPLSKSQLGIYAECVQHENEVFYNLPFLYVFDGRTNPKFQHSVGMTVQTLPVYAKFTDDTTVLEGLLSQTLLRDIDICTEKQRALLDSFNQTEVPYDDSQTIVSMFRRQVAKTPDNIAVVYQDKRFTYKELDEISDRIAAYIVRRV